MITYKCDVCGDYFDDEIQEYSSTTPERDEVICSVKVSLIHDARTNHVCEKCVILILRDIVK